MGTCLVKLSSCQDDAGSDPGEDNTEIWQNDSWHHTAVRVRI